MLRRRARQKDQVIKKRNKLPQGFKMEIVKLGKDIREALKEEGFQGDELEEEIDAVFIFALLMQGRIREYEENIKIRKEIWKALKEEGFQGDELEEEIDEVFDLELWRQERIKQDEVYKQKLQDEEKIRQEKRRQDEEEEKDEKDEEEERRAFQLTIINEANSREEKLRLCRQYL